MGVRFLYPAIGSLILHNYGEPTAGKIGYLYVVFSLPNSGWMSSRETGPGKEVAIYGSASANFTAKQVWSRK